jgi:2',3'-cyclic-nucleotide 2'-phosphodiesterase (5'-nucleotidase family)
MFSALGSAIGDATGASIVLHGLLDPTQGIAAGPIRMSDLWRVVPYENTMAVLEVTGTQITEILEEQARWIESPRFNAAWGLRCVFEATEEGMRVRTLHLADGTPIDPGARYRVATHSYALAGAGQRFPRLRALGLDPAVPCREGDRLTREILSDWVRSRRRVTAPESRSGWAVASVPAEPVS